MEKSRLKTLLGLTAGSTVGVGISYSALTICGVKGLSAAGITSGLATVGLGGGMVAGIGVLALPVLAGGIWGYRKAQKEKTKDASESENLTPLRLTRK